METAATVLNQSVDARIERHRTRFTKAYPHPLEVNQVRRDTKDGRVVFPVEVVAAGNTTEPELCPACGCTGLLMAERWSASRLRFVDDLSHGVRLMMVTYLCFAFRCGVCGLRLSDDDELEHAGLRREFEREEDWPLDEFEDLPSDE